jgi:hypothetical protein
MEEYMADLTDKIRQNMKQGGIGAIDRGAGKTLMWHRDMGNCWHLLMLEGLSMTNASYIDPETGRAPDHIYTTLDICGRMIRQIYAASIQDNINGLQAFRQLYDYLDEQEDGKEVYSRFCAFFFQAFFCYMFTSKKMALGLPQDCDDERVIEHTAVLQVLSMLDDHTKRDAIKQIVDRGGWPTNMDYSSLLKRLDNFLAVAEEDHVLFQQAAAKKAQQERLKREAKSDRKKAKKHRKKNG